MYNEFFGLKSAPFAIAPDPHYLYMSSQHQDALAYLIYGIQGNGGFVLLTGDIGTGKTTLCRCMLEHLPDKSDVAFILNPTLSSQELLASICDELAINYDRSCLRIKNLSDAIYHHLLQSHAAGRSTILVIDEAQSLDPEVLEQMRLLTNLETNEKKLLQIIMFGQPELREQINKPQLQQLAQRITARFHLGPLTAEDTSHYIEHRLTVSGYKQRANQEGIIPETLYKRIHQLSNGIPRLINILCDRALMGAYARNQDSISARVLEQAATEIFGYRPTVIHPAMSLAKPLSLGLAGVFILLLILKFIPDSELKTRQFISQLTNNSETPLIEQYESAALKELPALPATTNSADEDSKQAEEQVTIPSPEAVIDSAMQSATNELPPARKETQQLAKQDSSTLAQELNGEASKQKTNSMFSQITNTGTTAIQQAVNQTLAQAEPQTSGNSTAGNSEISFSSVTNRAADTADNMAEVAALPITNAAPGQDQSSEYQSFEHKSSEKQSLEKLSADILSPENQSPEKKAYKALFQQWNISFDSTPDPCLYATQQGLRCLHKQDNLLQLLKNNRPALIRIINSEGLITTLALLEIEEELAALSDGVTVWQIPLKQLKQKKIINYTLLWRPPEGYRGFVRAGDSGSTVLWLKQQMAKLTPLFQSEMDNQFDPRLSLYVKAFQHSQNLTQDGIAGPETLIRLNTLLADDVPALLSYRAP